MTVRWISVLLVLLLLTAACGPAAQATATPRRTVVPPVATATPAATPAPGQTPRPATPTPMAAASPTPAPAAGPVYGGTIRHPQREDPPTWDPVGIHVDPLMTSRNIAFNKLVSLWGDPPVSCKQVVTPVLAKDWKWVNDTTLEMTLKPGIKFHNKAPVNGREVVAQDVAVSMERFKGLPYMAGQSSLIDKVEAVDKYTFRFKAVQPWGGLVLELLGNSYGLFVLAPEAGGAKGELWGDPQKAFIGTGPFVFEKWTPGVKWTLTRNPDYWQKGKPYVDRVEYVVMPEASTQVAAMRSGQLNLNRDFNEPLIAELEKAVPGFQVVRCSSLGISGSNMFYMNSSGPPFNDVRVRRAVSMAIDRQAIIDTQYLRRAAAVGTLYPGLPYTLEVKDYPPEVRQYLEYHPDRAKQLLAETGYASGFKTKINVTTRYSAPAMAINEMLVNMLGQIGIQAELKILEYGLYSSTLLQAKYPVGEMGVTPGKQETPEDGQALRGPSKLGGTANRSLINDPEYDRLYQEFIASRDEAKRTELARQLQLRAADQAYRVILPIPDSTMAGRPELRNILWIASTRDYSALLENVWIAK